jgi:hypothetical protein
MIDSSRNREYCGSAEGASMSGLWMRNAGNDEREFSGDEVSSTLAILHHSHVKEDKKGEPAVFTGSVDSGMESIIEEYTMESAYSEDDGEPDSSQPSSSIVSSVDLIYYSNASMEENELTSCDDDSSYMELTVEEELDLTSEDPELKCTESESKDRGSINGTENSTENNAAIETAPTVQGKRPEPTDMRPRSVQKRIGIATNWSDGRSMHSCASGSFSLQLSQATSISGLTDNPQDAPLDDIDMVNEIKTELLVQLNELKSDLMNRLHSDGTSNPLTPENDNDGCITNMVHELRSSDSSWKSDSLSQPKSTGIISIAGSIENPQDGSSPDSTSIASTEKRILPSSNEWIKVLPKPRRNPLRSRRSWAKVRKLPVVAEVESRPSLDIVPSEEESTKSTEHCFLPRGPISKHEPSPPVEELNNASWKQKVQQFFKMKKKKNDPFVSTTNPVTDEVPVNKEPQPSCALQKNAMAKSTTKHKKSRAKLNHHKFLESKPDTTWAKVRPKGRMNAKR